MKNLGTLQINIFNHSRSANEFINNIIAELQKEAKDKDLSPYQRKMLMQDAKACLWIMKQLRDLDTMDSFYNPDGKYTGEFLNEEIKKLTEQS